MKGMRLSNAKSFWLLSIATNAITAVSAETMMRHGTQQEESLQRSFLRPASGSAAIENLTSLRNLWERRQTRSLEEGEDGNDGDDDDNNVVSFDEGHISAARCSSYKIEESENSNIEIVLKFNAAYGNGLDIFRVAQKSFVYYDYIDPQATNKMSQNNDGSVVQSESTFIVELENWLETSAILGLGKDQAPSCQQIENVQEVFQNNNNDKDEITKYFSITSGENDDSLGDWEPQLYLGPICGMGDDALNWGVFLDDTCTTYVPKWTHRYRSALVQGHIPYSNDAITLLKLNSYTSPVTSTIFEKQHHWSCENGDGLCNTLLSYSADTLYCQTPNIESENADAERRLEENNDGNDNEDSNEDEEKGDDDNANADADDGNEDGENGDDDNANANANDEYGDDAYAGDDFFTNGYQISQDNLGNIEAECDAVFLSFSYGEGTLEDYLKKHGQLRHTLNYKKAMKTLIQFSVLALILFCVVVGATMLVKRRRKKRKRKGRIADDHNQDQQKTRGRSKSPTKASKNGKKPSVLFKNKNKTNSSSSKTTTTSNAKSWFSRFRKNKNQIADEDKKEKLLKSSDRRSRGRSHEPKVSVHTRDGRESNKS